MQTSLNWGMTRGEWLPIKSWNSIGTQDANIPRSGLLQIEILLHRFRGCDLFGFVHRVLFRNDRSTIFRHGDIL